ncbi:lytic transglycosylase domain-containing protein [Methylocaldum sp. MU1018]
MILIRFLLGWLLSIGATLALAQDSAEDARELRILAQRHEHGRGVKQSYAEAYRLYCKAALLGDAQAAYSLGWMYFNGRGLPRKAGVAVGWFMRAAKTGDAYAARMLVRYEGITPADDPACRPAPAPVTASIEPSSNPDRKLVESWVSQIAPHYSVDPQLVLAVIQAESSFNPAALSSKNAQGLMQLIPATAERFGVKDIWNPVENIKGGTAYLHWLLRHFDGNVEWAVAAYNAGERTVEQYQGVPPYRETRNYVRRILTAYQKPFHPVPPPLAAADRVF